MARRIAYKDMGVERHPGLWWLDHMERGAGECAPTLIGDVVVVTSCNDGKHKPKSLHYKDRAIDLRIIGDRTGAIDASHYHVPMGLPEPRTWDDYVRIQQAVARQVWVPCIKAKLGRDFDVVLEDDHIHVEYDPHDLGAGMGSVAGA